MDINSKVIPLHLHPLGFIEAFLQFGGNLGDLLKNTNINENMLTAKDVKISYAQQSQIVLNGIDSCNKPGIGLLVGQTIDWCYNGPVGGVVNCSPSLAEAAKAFLRYVMISQPYYAMYLTAPHVYVDNRGMIVAPLRYFVSEDYDPRLYVFEYEYRLAKILRLWDTCGNKSVENTDVLVGLTCPEPAHSHMYRELPCTSVDFNCDQSYVAAHYTFITTPWRLFRKHAFDRIIEQSEEEFQRANIEPTATTQVRWHISTLFNQQASLEKVAEIMGLSPRALTRKLAAEKTSFRTIMHDVRMEIVSYHLQSSTLSVDEIAEIMGFSGASSLRRAIKNWSGSAVSNIRGEIYSFDDQIHFTDHRKAS
jgi:AraC-like DNA-binding protein